MLATFMLFCDARDGRAVTDIKKLRNPIKWWYANDIDIHDDNQILFPEFASKFCVRLVKRWEVESCQPLLLPYHTHFDDSFPPCLPHRRLLDSKVQDIDGGTENTLYCNLKCDSGYAPALHQNLASPTEHYKEMDAFYARYFPSGISEVKILMKKDDYDEGGIPVHCEKGSYVLTVNSQDASKLRCVRDPCDFKKLREKFFELQPQHVREYVKWFQVFPRHSTSHHQEEKKVGAIASKIDQKKSQTKIKAKTKEVAVQKVTKDKSASTDDVMDTLYADITRVFSSSMQGNYIEEVQIDAASEKRWLWQYYCTDKLDPGCNKDEPESSSVVVQGCWYHLPQLYTCMPAKSSSEDSYLGFSEYQQQPRALVFDRAIATLPNIFSFTMRKKNADPKNKVFTIIVGFLAYVNRELSSQKSVQYKLVDSYLTKTGATMTQSNEEAMVVAYRIASDPISYSLTRDISFTKLNQRVNLQVVNTNPDPRRPGNSCNMDIELPTYCTSEAVAKAIVGVIGINVEESDQLPDYASEINVGTSKEIKCPKWISDKSITVVCLEGVWAKSISPRVAVSGTCTGKFLKFLHRNGKYILL
jgi:hypothetical protein